MRDIAIIELMLGRWHAIAGEPKDHFPVAAWRGVGDCAGELSALVR